jgi:hypothetical protein
MDSYVEHFGLYANGLLGLVASLFTLVVMSLVLVIAVFTKHVGHDWGVHPVTGLITATTINRLLCTCYTELFPTRVLPRPWISIHHST